MSEVINVQVLKKAITDGVTQLVAISGYEEEISTICENAAEKVGLSSSDIKKRIKLAYKKLYKEEAFNREQVTAESIYGEVSTLVEEMR